MVSFLAKTRDLIIIIGIYTYFMAFVYVHFYFDSFGLSTRSLKIDYTEYLVYAYDVVSAPLFIFAAPGLIILLLVGNRVVRYLYPRKLRKSYAFLRKLIRYRFAGKLLQMVLLFPFLYYISWFVARQDYLHARIDLKQLRTIQFVFRQSAEGLGPYAQLDSIPLRLNELSGDIGLLKRDTSQQLRLLSESDAGYFVINQPPYDTVFHQLPTGYIYYVNKSDVLLSRIVLRSRPIK